MPYGKCSPLQLSYHAHLQERTQGLMVWSSYLDPIGVCFNQADSGSNQTSAQEITSSHGLEFIP